MALSGRKRVGRQWRLMAAKGLKVSSIMEMEKAIHLPSQKLKFKKVKGQNYTKNPVDKLQKIFTLERPTGENTL